MPGKRPRPTMRRTSSVSLIGSGSMFGECSPLPEHPKEKQKSSNLSSHCHHPATSTTTAIPPRQVIGFHPKVYIEEEEHLVLPPTSPRPQHQQAKSPTGSNGSPRSGLGDLLANGSRPWERRDEGVGLSIVAALGAASQEDCNTHNNSNHGRMADGFPPVPPRKTNSPQRFAPPKTSPPIPISPGSNSPSSHHCPSSHRYTQNCAPQFGLSSAMQESMMVQAFSSGVSGSRGRVSNNGLMAPWQQADMEVEAIMMPVVAPHHIAPRPSFRQQPTGGLDFLESCYYCKRPLGEGRDVYMYRGDKAFCSPECRHQQIVVDERPERCSQAAMKHGGTDGSRHTSQRNRVVGAGTAAAA